MKTADKHYKLVNSATGYAIFYHSVSSNLEADKIKEELEKVRAQAAVKNNLFIGTIFWEEITDDNITDNPKQ